MGKNIFFSHFKEAKIVEMDEVYVMGIKYEW